MYRGKNMKVGMYLAYNPPSKTISLKQEGLGRYVSFLIKAFIANDDSVVIACPDWLVETMYELFEQESIDKSRVEMILPQNAPLIYKIYVKFNNREKKRRKSKKYFAKAALKITDKFLDLIIGIKNIIELVCFIFLLGLLGIIALPFVLVGTIVLTLLITILKIVKGNSKFSIKSVLKKIYFSLFNNEYIKSFYYYIKNRYSTFNITKFIREKSAFEIIRRINSMKEPADIWYCPMAFWPEFNNIKGTKVVCAPDIVTSEFPFNFSTFKASISTNEVKKTIEGGTYYITYCEYLRKTLVIEQFVRNPKYVVAIPHGPNDMKHFIDVNSYYSKNNGWTDCNIAYCRKFILPTIVSHSVKMNDFLNAGKGFSFDDVQYIFYSSQLRGNKNIFTLIKAYDYLKKKKDIHIKLFLTCMITNDSDIWNYILDNNLQNDILCFHSVTNQQLAALYACSLLSVNPTLYEGGFPFTFSEGMSVGTPSIFGNIPQVVQEFSGYDLDDCLFNPYDFKDLANKIEYGLNNRDLLYKKQKVLFDKMCERDWQKVGREYIDAFNYFIKLDKTRVKNNEE